MTEKKDVKNRAGTLRGQAEDIARKEAAKVPDKLDTLSPGAADKLLHELRVHQIELEMQNEELRASQVRLEESRAQYFELYDLAPVGYFSISEKGIILGANLTGANLLGEVSHELPARRFTSFIFKEDLDTYYEHRRQLFQTRELQSWEMRMVRRDGSRFWAWVEATIGRDWMSGEPVCRAALSDITEHKREAEELKISEARYRLLAEHMTDTIWLLDTDFKTTYVSPSAEKLRGYTSQEILEMPMEKHMTAESLKLVFDVVSKELPMVKADAGYNPILTLEIENTCKDGSTVWTENKLSIQRDDNGKPVSVLGEARNITERKRVEKELRESEKQYRDIIDFMPISIFEVDTAINLVAFNQTAIKVFGYTEEDYRAGMSALQFLSPEEWQRIGENMARVIDGTSIPGEEYNFCRKDGSTFKGLIYAVPNIQQDKPAGIRGAIVDITDRKRLEEERQRVQKLESVGLLAGGIAHDFNNILTSVLGNISLARMEAAPGSELCESLEQAEKASLRAKDLTRQLLTFSKGGAPVRILAPLTELLRDTAGFALRGSNVKCRFSIPGDLWHAEIDPGQVSQVIHNLVINAQQSMLSGGTIKISAENMAINGALSLGRGLPLAEGDYVRIAVTDHGSGIPKDLLQQIFDPFFTTKQNGSGLGLATSFSIARQHGGHLSVESEAGSGSTFYLYLPASSRMAVPEQPDKDGVKYTGTTRILVMDDEQAVREVTGRMLRRLGYEDVEFAADGSEAVRLYKAAGDSGHPFSIAILDLTVAGGMGGQETIKNLLKIEPGVRAIVSSGYADDPVIANYREYGFSGIVTKPYTPGELGKVIYDLLK